MIIKNKNLSNNIMVKVSTVEKRKLTIQKKRLEKQLKKEQYKIKLGEDKIKAIQEKIQETKQSNKYGLPKYTEDYKPSKDKRSKHERTLIEIPNQKVEVIDNKIRTTERKALGGTFRDITLDSEGFYFISNQIMEHPFDKTVYKIRYPNKSLIVKSIVKTVYRQIMNKPDDINLYFNLVIKFIMVEETTKNGKVMQQFIEFYFNSDTAGILHTETEIHQWAVVQYKEFIKYMELTGQSNLKFWSIEYIKIQISQRKKTRAGSYIYLP